MNAKEAKRLLQMPEMIDKKLKGKILKKYADMIANMNFSDKLDSILTEMIHIGTCYAFFEYDEKAKEWKNISVLPPEEIMVSLESLDNVKILWKPNNLRNFFQKHLSDILYGNFLDSEENYNDFIKGLNDGEDGGLSENEKTMLSSVNYELVKHFLNNDGCLVLDIEPYRNLSFGSFCQQFPEKKYTWRAENDDVILAFDFVEKFVEEKLFLPVAEANCFYKVDEVTLEKTYFYPKFLSRKMETDNPEQLERILRLYNKETKGVSENECEDKKGE